MRVVIIPARMGSTRLPGKPLLDVAGLPLVEHVRRRCWLAPGVQRVIVAAEDEAIVRAIAGHGGEAVRTPPVASGTDRVHEAVRSLGLSLACVVNVQGDMPLVDPSHVDALFTLLEQGADLATLVAPFPGGQPPADPAIVKVSVDSHGRARTFCRHAPPDGSRWLHHVGMYGYGRSALERFVALPLGQREQSERLEQLRWLEAGGHIQVATVPVAASGVDTPSQLESLRRRFHAGDLKPPPLTGAR